MLSLSSHLIPRIVVIFALSFSAMTAESAIPLSEIVAQPLSPFDQRLGYGPSKHNFALRWTTQQTPPKARVIYVHGGCWLSEFDHTHADSFVSYLGENGFDAWTLEYRRTGATGGGWPTSLLDVQQGIKAIMGDDTVTPTVIIGHSAGGHLALLAARSEWYAQTPVATVALAPITDMVAYAMGKNSCQQGTVPFMGAAPHEQPDAYRNASPSSWDFSDRLVWILQGIDDIIVPKEHANVLGAESLLLPSVGHFDWLMIDSAAQRKLMDVLKTALTTLEVQQK
ncbi:MAG: alpha/beta hydrolase family protein [Aequoribacter sp.]|uniref:alpha/beta hydrolase family protein n=1 Tax=Aequoribacter sp. TaxID=2847771 RepID=UPI003C314926